MDGPARPGRPFHHGGGRWGKCDPARPWPPLPPMVGVGVGMIRAASMASPSSTAGAGGRKEGARPSMVV